MPPHASPNITTSGTKNQGSVRVRVFPGRAGPLQGSRGRGSRDFLMGTVFRGEPEPVAGVFDLDRTDGPS